MRLLWITSPENPDPTPIIRQALGGFSVELVCGGAEGLQRLAQGGFDAALADFPLPGWRPEEWLEEAQRMDSALPVLIRDEDTGVGDAVRLTKLGAYHCANRGCPPEELALALETAVEYRRARELALLGEANSEEPWRRLLVGRSQGMENVARIIRLVGPRRCTVLITGETGTGKEVIARAIHLASPRAHQPWVAVNCTALPENLLEAELFGHVRGAFTGALNPRVGRFEQANRGTLFLDEVGDMPLEIQAKLLRVLQEREFQRLGSSETVRVDVRVIAASNVDLAQRVRDGAFREDLYYRLNVVPVHVPPLRERFSDVSLLVHHFLDKFCRQEGLPLKQVSQETLARLSGFEWPGNVRQLENAVEMAVALSGDRLTLYPSDFPLPSSRGWKHVPVAGLQEVLLPDEGLDFERTIGRIEWNILDQALRKTGGNKKQAADMLGLKRTTLAAKLKSLEAVVG